MRGKQATIAWLFDTLGVNRLARSGGSGTVVVLNYHRIGDPSHCEFDRGLFSATEEEFDEQLDYLGREADLISPADLDDIVARRGRPGRSVLITFDDGYADNFHLAWPILRSHRAEALFFLTTGQLDRPAATWWDEVAWMVRRIDASRLTLPEFSIDAPLKDDRQQAIAGAINTFKRLPTDRGEDLLSALADLSGGRCPEAVASHEWMTWEEAREMAAGGMHFGGHTVSHPVLSRLSSERQRAEIYDSRDRVAAELGAAPTSFSYPVGQPESFTPLTRKLVAEAGYRWAFSFYGGAWQTTRFDRLNIPRIPVRRGATSHEFRTRLSWPGVFSVRT